VAQPGGSTRYLNVLSLIVGAALLWGARVYFLAPEEWGRLAPDSTRRSVSIGILSSSRFSDPAFIPFALACSCLALRFWPPFSLSPENSSEASRQF
jgi:hypothetical protein